MRRQKHHGKQGRAAQGFVTSHVIVLSRLGRSREAQRFDHRHQLGEDLLAPER